MKIIIIGPAHPLRGGLATYDHRLAKEFIRAGHDCSIYSFSLQYPNFLFPGKTQFTTEPPPEGITIHTVINSVKPGNWIKVGKQLRDERPDAIIVRYWLPFMAPSLGTILRKVKKNKHTRIICIADNVIPHERRPGDKLLTRYFVKPCDAFVTMSEKVFDDLKRIEKKKLVRLIPHPIYDNFGDLVPKMEARRKLGVPEEGRIILFFGFIRKYKGLDMLLQAMKVLKDRSNQPGSTISIPKLIIAGEFYEDEKKYRDLIEKLDISDQLILRTDFIPDSEVKYYICAADAVIQPYRNATQSGVTPLCYHFEKPMVVTNVGGLPTLVANNEAGVVVEPDPTALADGILRFYQLGENYFIPHLRIEKHKYSWAGLVKTITTMIYQRTVTLD